MIKLTAVDFERVGQLAAHCDNKKLAIAIEEAIRFDLGRILCGMIDDLDANWDATSGEWYDLINGSTYTGCGSKPRKHYGVKTALIYFAYARYVVLNGFNDTPVGHVNKSHPFSIPKPLKELQAFSDKYRNMGHETLRGIENYACITREYYPNFDRRYCEPCGCAGECEGEEYDTKGYGFRSKAISKWDV